MNKRSLRGLISSLEFDDDEIEVCEKNGHPYIIGTLERMVKYLKKSNLPRKFVYMTMITLIVMGLYLEKMNEAGRNDKDSNSID